MKREGEQTLLRVFLQNTDKATWWTNAQDALLNRALKRHMEGATILEGACGVVGREWVACGRFAIVQHRPVILEFMDGPTAVGAFLADVVEVAPRALVTLEGVHVLAYRRRADEAARVAARLQHPARPMPAAYLPDPEEFPVMRTAVDGQLLRIFFDDTDTYHEQPLFRALMEKVRDLGISNAVVLRAPKGFGTHQRVHSDFSPDYVSELPLVVEVVGTANEIGALIPFLDEAVPEGLVTVENLKILRPAEGTTDG